MEAEYSGAVKQNMRNTREIAVNTNIGYFFIINVTMIKMGQWGSTVSSYRQHNRDSANHTQHTPACTSRYIWSHCSRLLPVMNLDKIILMKTLLWQRSLWAPPREASGGSSSSRRRLSSFPNPGVAASPHLFGTCEPHLCLCSWLGVFSLQGHVQ